MENVNQCRDFFHQQLELYLPNVWGERSLVEVFLTTVVSNEKCHQQGVTDVGCNENTLTHPVRSKIEIQDVYMGVSF